MNNIYAYIREQGALSFESSPLNEADNLVFCVLSYLDLSEVVPSGIGAEVTLYEAAKKYFAGQELPPAAKDDGSNRAPVLSRLFLRMAMAPRYRGVKLSGYREILDPASPEQFTALCIRYRKDALYVAFRGTSDSLVGWREDFLLAATGHIPSQRDALRYLKRAGIRYPGCRIDVGGHSKGGHLALYAAALCSEVIRSRIGQVWSNDGPDLPLPLREMEGYQALGTRIRHYVPKDSVASMIYSHEDHYFVVDSCVKGVASHDAKTWVIENGSFVILPQRNKKSFRIEEKVRSWVEEMPQEERLRFIQVFFEILYATGADTFPKLLDLGSRAFWSIWQAFRRQSCADRKKLRQFLGLLIEVVRS